MATPILVTALLLKQGKAVRAMVRNEDERAQALRDMGAEVVVGDLLDLDSLHRMMAGCETMYFGVCEVAWCSGTLRVFYNTVSDHNRYMSWENDCSLMVKAGPVALFSRNTRQLRKLSSSAPCGRRYQYYARLRIVRPERLRVAGCSTTLPPSKSRPGASDTQKTRR